MKKQQRKSGFELMRLVALMFIVFGHINNRNIGNGLGITEQYNQVNYLILMGIESLSLWTVSGFILLSGYFSSETKRRSLTKILMLIVQLLIFNEIKYILTATMIGEPIQTRYLLYNLLPTDYYVVLYMVLYIISPYINVALNDLDRPSFNKLLLVLIILFPIWNWMTIYFGQYFNSSLYGMSTIGMYGNQEGYTLITFIILYIIGAYIKRYNIKVNSLICIAISLLCSYLIFNQSISQITAGLSNTAWNIDSPFVLGSAVANFLFFKNIKWHSSFINEVSKGVFTGYLIQDFIIKRLINVEFICLQEWYIMICYMIGIGIGIILLAYIISKIYHLLTDWFFNLIQPILDILNIGLRI